MLEEGQRIHTLLETTAKRSKKTADVLAHALASLREML